MPQEKRRHARRPVTLAARTRARPDEAPATGTTADLSEGGLFLKTRQLSTLGATLHVELEAPDHRTVTATAEVTHIEPSGMGLHFTRMDPDSALLLNLLLSV